MTQFTKERIEQFIKSPLEHGLTRSEQMEMARQLLAGLEQEPVADVVAWHHQTEERTCDIRLRRHDLATGPLYAAPQLPQPAVGTVYSSVIAEQLAHVLSGMDVTDHQRAVINCAVDRLNKNAVMLQGAEPDFREISNSSTKHFRENAETSTNCPCCGRKPLKNKTCSVAGCEGKHVAHGLCKKHYDMEHKKDPDRRDGIRAADDRYRAKKSAAPQQEVK